MCAPNTWVPAAAPLLVRTNTDTYTGRARAGARTPQHARGQFPLSHRLVFLFAKQSACLLASTCTAFLAIATFVCCFPLSRVRFYFNEPRGRPCLFTHSCVAGFTSLSFGIRRRRRLLVDSYRCVELWIIFRIKSFIVGT